MSTRHKIILEPRLLESVLAVHRSEGRRIVLTNGAFDVLHVGHIRALEAARAAGDVLLVAINSDESVRSYKGPERPLVPQDERAEVVAALECVDLVTLFFETTAHDLLRRFCPDVYAKGRDYDAKTLPEADAAREVGAELAFVGDEKTHAASDIIAKARRQSGGGQ